MPGISHFSRPSRPRILPATRWLVAGVAAAVVTAVLSAPQVALAHAKLKSSLPAANATVAEAPRELRLTFSERPEVAVSRVVLLAAGTDTVATGKPIADAKSPATLVVPVTATLAAGSYTVRYRVTGRDGHPITGSYAFAVGRAH